MLQINIKHLEKTYGDKTILQDISFQVSFGERIGIVGTNGCGKSTLLHILAKIDEADSGTIYFQEPCRTELLKQNNFQDESLPLSGGEWTKLALRNVFSSHPNLLLLDEPTNNLDFQGITSLIEQLNTHDGTILIVSHDRYFLDQTVSTIIEIEDGKAIEYLGNYTFYRKEKERRYHEKMHRYTENKKQQQQIQDAITKTHQWSEKAHRDSTKPDPSGLRGTKEGKRVKAKKMDKKIKNDKKRLEKLIVTGEQKPIAEKDVFFEIKKSGTHGRRILQASDVCKSFQENTLFSHSDFTIMRGEKVAMFGPNGCGKSTLIQMLIGEDQEYSGEIWLSPSSQPYVLPQTFSELPEDKTILEYLTNKLGHISGKDRTTLNNMGLTSRHLLQQIKTLSFGEKTKIKLAKPILNHRDFIILDEPTNHLDLHSREMLQTTLCQYEGTLLIVSHDIYFLKEICNKTLLFQDNQIRKLEHSFAEYLERMK